MKKVRVRDIAEAAGVSAATVSNVLNQHNRVGAETSKRILEIAKEMGYGIAKSAALQHCIRFVLYQKHGQIITDTSFFSQLITCVEQAFRALKYDVMISYINVSKDPDAEQTISGIIKDDTRAILLLATEMDESDLALFAHARAPVMAIDNSFLSYPINSVVMNNYEAGWKAAECFLQNGHTHLGFVQGTCQLNNQDMRKHGFCAAVRHAGLEIAQQDLFRVNPVIEGAYQDMAQILEQRDAPLPTALFVANDLMAFGVMRALQERGYILPHDISIIGMDDMPFCKMVSPCLSSVSVPIRQIAGAAARRFVEIIENGDESIQKTLLDVQLIQRDSVRTLP